MVVPSLAVTFAYQPASAFRPMLSSRASLKALLPVQSSLAGKVSAADPSDEHEAARGDTTNDSALALQAKPTTTLALSFGDGAFEELETHVNKTNAVSLST